MEGTYRQIQSTTYIQRRHHTVEKRLRRVAQNRRQRALHQHIAAQNPRAQALQTAAHVLKHARLIVHHNPAHPPAGHQEPLRQAAARQHRHAARQRTDRHALDARKHKVLVDLVRNDRHELPFGQPHDPLQMRPREHTAARITRIGHNQRRRIRVHQTLHLLQVRFPVALRQQIVRAHLDAMAQRQRAIDREARPRYQDILAGTGERRDADVQRAGAAAAQQHIGRTDGRIAVIRSHIVGDRLAGRLLAARMPVAVARARFEGRSHGANGFRCGVEIAKGRWVACCARCVYILGIKIETKRFIFEMPLQMWRPSYPS